MYSLLNMGIFHCYVSLPEGNHEADDLLVKVLKGPTGCNKMYQTLQAAGEAVDKMLTQDAFGAQQCLGFQAKHREKPSICEFQPDLVTFPILIHLPFQRWSYTWCFFVEGKTCTGCRLISHYILIARNSIGFFLRMWSFTIKVDIRRMVPFMLSHVKSTEILCG